MARKQEWYTAGQDITKPLETATEQQAQTFTLGTVGNNLTFDITQIKVLISKTAGNVVDADFEIQGVQPDGSPDGTAISTGTAANAKISTSLTWVTVTMTSATLEANQQYALVIVEGYDAGNAKSLLWGSDNADASYGGGAAWSSTDSGATWTEGSGDDNLFQIEGGTYGGTLCTLADAVNKAGANASPGGTEEVLVSDFVKQSEGYISWVTRFDWVSKYSSLTNDVKFGLNKVVSAMAAIDIISYDPSGFTDIVEAETIINVHRETVQLGISLLRNQNVKTFIEGDT